MAGLVGNLLDMARLNAGQVSLRKEWQPLEVVGASLKLSAPVLAGLRVGTDLAPDLPWLEFDAVLLERVFCNLLENSAKYSCRQRAALVGPPRGRLGRGCGRGCRAGFPGRRSGRVVRHVRSRRARIRPPGNRPRAGDLQGDCRGAWRHDCRRQPGAGRCPRQFRLPVGEPPAWSDEEGA